MGFLTNRNISEAGCGWHCSHRSGFLDQPEHLNEALSGVVPSIGRVSSRPAEPTGGRTWDTLRDAADQHTPALHAVRPAGPGCCAVCRGRAPAGFRHCYRCSSHRRCAPGLLADLVVPISYSVGGTAYSAALWQYKSAVAETASRDIARTALRLRLLVFLHDHGPCLWSHAGVGAPTHVAVVPSGRGCAGTHPLRVLAEPYLTLPWAGLVIRPGELVLGRDMRVDRFRATGRLANARVLLLDDTWTSGASAQSAAAALKLAGARSVVTVILGRHLNPSKPHLKSFIAGLAEYPFRRDVCAVHKPEQTGSAKRNTAGIPVNSCTSRN